MVVQNGLFTLVVLVIMTLATFALTRAQNTNAEAITGMGSEQQLLNELKIPEFSDFGFLLTYFPSQLIHNGIALKSYVRSKRFQKLREQFGDLRAVDALYIQALRLTEGNTAMALFYCTIATMDHRIVGIRVPIFNVFFPLSNESEREFSRRVNNLPSHFYSDSPSQPAGDRDKLQHFLGSGLIAYLFESRGAAERVGNFIEFGEDAFIIDGAYDDRDMRANRQGREFGLALLNTTARERPPLPSDFLQVHFASTHSVQTSITHETFCGVR